MVGPNPTLNKLGSAYNQLDPIIQYDLNLNILHYITVLCV